MRRWRQRRTTPTTPTVKGQCSEMFLHTHIPHQLARHRLLALSLSLYPLPTYLSRARTHAHTHTHTHVVLLLSIRRHALAHFHFIFIPIRSLSFRLILVLLIFFHSFSFPSSSPPFLSSFHQLSGVADRSKPARKRARTVSDVADGRDLAGRSPFSRESSGASVGGSSASHNQQHAADINGLVPLGQGAGGGGGAASGSADTGAAAAAEREAKREQRRVAARPALDTRGDAALQHALSEAGYANPNSAEEMVIIRATARSQAWYV